MRFLVLLYYLCVEAFFISENIINIIETVNVLEYDVSAEVTLESLVDHTVQRITEVQKDVIEQLKLTTQLRNTRMTYKWGCDGSSDHATYRQKFTENNENITDEYMMRFV